MRNRRIRPEVYACRGQFYVKDKEAAEWQTAAAELDALPVLLRDPHQPLAAMLAAGELQLKREETNSESCTCETYVLEPAGVNAELVTCFEKEAILEKLKTYLWSRKKAAFST